VLSEDQIARLVPGVVEGFGDRLTPEDLKHPKEYAGVGEWLMAITGLIGALGRRGVAITADERSDLLQLLETFRQVGPHPYLNGRRELLDSLPFLPEPPADHELVPLISTEGWTHWQPADETERDLLAAAEAGEGQRFAELLSSATFWLPVPDDVWPQSIPRPDGWHGVAFTSLESADWVLGGVVDSCTCEMAGSLIDSRPPGFELIVNPGLPISAALTLAELRDLEPLVSAEAVVDTAAADVRRLVLSQLGASGRIVGPTNELEQRLADAVARDDFRAYGLALVGVDVVVPAAVDVPWRVLGDDESAVIAAFTSARLYEQVALDHGSRRTLPLLELLRAWPGPDHLLLLNPGTSMELLMVGDDVPRFAEALEANLRS
jgi:hypothetical protein